MSVIRKHTRFFKHFRLVLLAKHRHRCAKCGSSNDLQVDHVIALSAGGTDDISNLQILCGLCNRKKAGAKNPEHQKVRDMLEERRIAMKNQWAAENAEMYRNTPKL